MLFSIDLLDLFPLLPHIPLYNYTLLVFFVFFIISTTVDAYLGSFWCGVIVCNDAVKISVLGSWCRYVLIFKWKCWVILYSNLDFGS